VRLRQRLLGAHRPRVAEQQPQVLLLGRQTVEQQVLGLPAQQRAPHRLGEAAVRLLLGRGHDQRQRREEEVDELGRVRVVDVRLEFGEQVERVLELLVDVQVVVGGRELGAHGQHAVARLHRGVIAVKTEIQLPNTSPIILSCATGIIN